MPNQDRPLILLLSCICFYLRAAQACVICENVDRAAAISPIPGYEFVNSCGSLQDLASVAINPESKSCSELQSIGTMCGCPSKLMLGEQPCTLCDMKNSTLAMPVYLEEEDVQPYSSGLAGLITQFTPTCQMLQAYLSSIPADTQECSNLRDELLVDQCGCGGNLTNKNEDVVELCQVCSDENEVFAVPERDITKITEGLGFEVLFPTINTTTDNITCSILQATLSSQSAESLLCENRFLNFFRGICECPWKGSRGQRPCTEVVNCNVDSFNPDIRLDFVTEAFGYPFAPTCQELWWIMRGLREESNECFAMSQYAHVCGCGVRPYLGATTEGQQAALAWIPRCVGFLSAIGSIMIIWDVFVVSRRKLDSNHNYSMNGRLTMLQQLVCGMSIFDIFSSLGNIFSTLPIPEYQYFESSSTSIPTGVYGAKGNANTCTAQGFFIQLGYTSAFYNMVLSVYYFLVIKKGMRESQLQRLKYWFHVPTLLVGFGLAFAGIPFYENIFAVCHIPAAVNIGTWGPEGENTSITDAESDSLLTVFSIVPISIVVVVGGINMILIYLHVRKLDKAANRWRMGHRLAQSSAEAEEAGSSSHPWSKQFRAQFSRPKRTSQTAVTPSNRISNEVWWQAVFYMGSFLMTWPIYYVANFNVLEQWDNYSFWIAVTFLYPLQGFWNAMVYFRPRMFQYVRKQKQERSRAPNEKKSSICEGIKPSDTSGGETMLATSKPAAEIQNSPEELGQEQQDTRISVEMGTAASATRIDVAGHSTTLQLPSAHEA